MQERRRFYRIDDSAVLNYRVIPESYLEEGIARLKVLSTHREQLQHSLVSMETRLAQLFSEIAEPLPELAEAFELINRKVNILSRMVGNELEVSESGESAPVIPTHEINLSASGLAFRGPASLKEGDLLEIEMTLFPEFHHIKAFGHVVACRKVPKADVEFNQKIAVDFVFLREEDLEFVISHVLRKQSEVIRTEREDKHSSSRNYD